MIQNTLEKQIITLIKADYPLEKIIQETAAPVKLIKTLQLHYREQLAHKNSHASNLHNQAIYAMSLSN
ncbi:MAG: hypothetical protein V7731_02775 [Amphritea sp.]